MKTFLLTIALLLCAAPALAQPAPAPPSAADMDKARALFAEGTEAYKLGNFQRALTAYEAAYKLYPAPQFLFNIAQCYFQLQNWERAEFFFEGYLRDVPNAPNRKLVDELIGEARTNAASKKDADKRKLDLERERFELERREKERQAREAEERLALEKTRRVEPPTPVYKKWWFWGLVGGAVAGATITTIVVSSDTTTVLPSGSLGTWDRRP